MMCEYKHTPVRIPLHSQQKQFVSIAGDSNRHDDDLRAFPVYQMMLITG